MNDPGKSQVARIVFGVGALLFILLGLGFYVFADQLGLNPETARMLAIVFAVVGIADFVVLSLWNRLFRPRG